MKNVIALLVILAFVGTLAYIGMKLANNTWVQVEARTVSTF